MATAAAAAKDDDAFHDAASEANDEYLIAARSGPYSSKIRELEKRLQTARAMRKDHAAGQLEYVKSRAKLAHDVALANEKAIEHEGCDEGRLERATLGLHRYGQEGRQE